MHSLCPVVFFGLQGFFSLLLVIDLVTINTLFKGELRNEIYY